MDKIYLKDIEIFANHGVFKEEKNLGQKFILSLELSLDIKETAKTCDLTKSQGQVQNMFQKKRR